MSKESCWGTPRREVLRTSTYEYTVQTDDEMMTSTLFWVMLIVSERQVWQGASALPQSSFCAHGLVVDGWWLMAVVMVARKTRENVGSLASARRSSQPSDQPNRVNQTSTSKHSKRSCRVGSSAWFVQACLLPTAKWKPGKSGRRANGAGKSANLNYIELSRGNRINPRRWSCLKSRVRD